MFVLISKRLPPTRCGIGDHVRGLAETLAARGASVAGLAWEKPAAPITVDAAFPISYLSEPTAGALSNALAALAASSGKPLGVILHTSQFDAHPRGLAGWLVRGLREARAHGLVRYWAMMMHEIWLPGLARRRDWWLYPAQRCSFARLVRDANAVAVTTETYARRIRRLAPGSQPAVLPVFSNFEEPSEATVLSAPRDAGAWAVFGSNQRLRDALSSLLDSPRAVGLRETIRRLEVFGGDPDSDIAARLARQAALPSRYQPAIAASLAAEILRACHATWIDYRESQDDPPLLGKSTLLSSALANGALPVLAFPATGFGSAGDPIPFWYSAENPPPPADSAAARAARAANFAWYHRHAARAIHARWYETALPSV